MDYKHASPCYISDFVLMWPGKKNLRRSFLCLTVSGSSSHGCLAFCALADHHRGGTLLQRLGIHITAPSKEQQEISQGPVPRNSLSPALSLSLKIQLSLNITSLAGPNHLEHEPKGNISYKPGTQSVFIFIYNVVFSHTFPL